jgi:hypothetical protein
MIKFYEEGLSATDSACRLLLIAKSLINKENSDLLSKEIIRIENEALLVFCIDPCEYSRFWLKAFYIDLINIETVMNVLTDSIDSDTLYDELFGGNKNE